MSNILNGLAFPEVIWPTSRGQTPTEDDIEIEKDEHEVDQSPPPQDRIFYKFIQLPPEIRHKIWRATIPSPGINFFNIHSFPGDHENVNLSTSPPWLYFDMRRLSIHDDDETVSQYDPSVWQQRVALRQVCHEARILLSIPDDKLATVTLTRPKRGLYIQAGDGQLGALTPWYPSQVRRAQMGPRQPDNNQGGTDNLGGGSSRQENDHHIDRTYGPYTYIPGRNATLADPTKIIHEPVVRRTIQLHKDEVFCLSIENCSLNLPYEESGEGNEDLFGWSCDPQLMPLPDVPLDHFCFEMCRDISANPAGVVSEMIEDMRQDIWTRQLQARGWKFGTAGDPEDESATHGLGKGGSLEGVPHVELLDIMLDTRGIEVGSRQVEELTGKRRSRKKRFLRSVLMSMASNGQLDFSEDKESRENKRAEEEEARLGNDGTGDPVAIYWDRFSDCYLPLPWKKEIVPGLQVGRCLTKVCPESNDVRMQYFESARLKSPKRPPDSWSSRNW